MYRTFGMLIEVPKLWTETIETHRREVQHAILNATAALVAEHGVTNVTMSQIAEATGIGRATLYKYFPDVATILEAWHEEHVAEHLKDLAEARDRHEHPRDRLTAVLRTYARIMQERSRHHEGGTHGRHAGAAAGHGRHGHAHGEHSGDVSALVHQREHIARAERRLSRLFAEVIRDAATSGEARRDVSPSELAAFCLNALRAAADARTNGELARLVTVTLNALGVTERRV